MQQLQEFKLPKARSKHFIFDFDQASVQLFKSIRLELHNSRASSIGTLSQNNFSLSGLTSISSVQFAC